MKKKAFLLITLLLLTSLSFARENEINFEEKAHGVAEDFTELLDSAVDDTLFISGIDFGELENAKTEIKKFAESKQNEIWFNVGSDENPIEQRNTIPIYSEIAFIGPEGNELIKWTVKGFSDELRDVSLSKNTKFKNETYFLNTKEIGEEKVFIGKVNSWYTSKEEIFKELPKEEFGKYEKVIGRDVMKEGIIRFSSPVFDENEFIGIVVLSMDYRVLQAVSKHIEPTKNEPVVSTTYSGNYLLVFDDEGSTIVHPKPDNIRGFLENGDLAGFNEPDSNRDGHIFNLYKYKASTAYNEMAKRTLEEKKTYTASATDVGGRTKITLTVPILYSNEKTNYAKKGIFGGIMISIAFEEKMEAEETPDVEQELEEPTEVLEESIESQVNPMDLIYAGLATIVVLIAIILYVINSKRFAFGKLSRKLVIVLLLFVVVPFAIVELVNLQSMDYSEQRTGEVLGSFFDEHERHDVLNEINYLVETIELRLEGHLNTFKIVSIKSEMPLLLSETEKTGKIEDNHFYPADKTKRWIKLQNYFKQVYNHTSDEFDMIRLFHSNGYIVNGVIFGEEDVSDYKGDKSWFKNTLDPTITPGGTFYVSPISIARRTNSPAIRYTMPIDINGKRKGLLVANFSASAITKQIQEFSHGEKGYALFVDFAYENAEGKIFEWPVIISRSMKGGIVYEINEEESAKAIVSREQLIGDSGFIEFKKNTEKIVVSYKKVNVPNKDWFVLIVIPEEEFFSIYNYIKIEIEDINQNSMIVSLLVLLGAIIILVPAGFFISRSLSGPIDKLHAMARELSKGNFEARAKIKTGNELEELGNTMNKTAEALERMDSEHKQLEHAKTEFLSITSHELRSPMTPMRAQLQMLLGGYFGKINKKQRESAEIVLRNTERLDRIILDFLEISRIEAARLKFRFVKTSLKPHVERLVGEMDGFMPEKKIKIEAKIGSLPVIEVDPDRVIQILRNLVNNAKKFSPENSMISIIVQKKNGMIQFSVKDQGIGISKEAQLKIFEPFYQEEQTMYREHGGTGLGLAICKGIVESQNGKMWIESDPGKGSTFYFTIPLDPVREIKPIKILFSQQEDIEKNVKDILINCLGPLGESEFRTLKNKGLIYESIVEYLNKLSEQDIISTESAIETTKKLARVYGVKR